jgi:hypothetical protein
VELEEIVLVFGDETLGDEAFGREAIELKSGWHAFRVCRISGDDARIRAP